MSKEDDIVLAVLCCILAAVSLWLGRWEAALLGLPSTYYMMPVWPIIGACTLIGLANTFKYVKEEWFECKQQKTTSRTGHTHSRVNRVTVLLTLFWALMALIVLSALTGGVSNIKVKPTANPLGRGFVKSFNLKLFGGDFVQQFIPKLIAGRKSCKEIVGNTTFSSHGETPMAIVPKSFIELPKKSKSMIDNQSLLNPAISIILLIILGGSVIYHQKWIKPTASKLFDDETMMSLDPTSEVNQKMDVSTNTDLASEVKQTKDVSTMTDSASEVNHATSGVDRGGGSTTTDAGYGSLLDGETITDNSIWTGR